MFGLPPHLIDELTSIPAKFDTLQDTLGEILVTLKQGVTVLEQIRDESGVNIEG